MRSGPPILRYAAGWLAAGALVVGVALALGGGTQDRVSLPPLQQTDLASAARTSGCRLERARRARTLNPVVDGTAGARAPRPGVYERPLREGELVAALRRGVVVVHYRAGLPDEAVDELRAVQAAVPNGTIVVPNGSRMPFQVAITSFRRLLGCPRYAPRALDALRLFRGRYLGRRAPERSAQGSTRPRRIA